MEDAVISTAGSALHESESSASAMSTPPSQLDNTTEYVSQSEDNCSDCAVETPTLLSSECDRLVQHLSDGVPSISTTSNSVLESTPQDSEADTSSLPATPSPPPLSGSRRVSHIEAGERPSSEDQRSSPSEIGSKSQDAIDAYSTPLSSPPPIGPSYSPASAKEWTTYGLALTDEGVDHAQRELDDKDLYGNTLQNQYRDDTDEAESPDVGRLYTAQLGVPEHMRGGKSLSLSVISDAGDQQHKRQKSTRDDGSRSARTKANTDEIFQRPDSVTSIPTPVSQHEFQNELFEALVEMQNPETSSHPAPGFLPKAQLYRLVNETSVARELNKYLAHVHTQDKIKEYASTVCSETDVLHGGKLKIKSFRKIFALLVLTEASSSISMFLEEGVSDLDLPLAVFKRGKMIELRRRGSEGKPSEQSLKCFSHHIWSPSKLRTFEQYQWAMLAPFFSQGDCGDVKHYLLNDRHILPFVAPPDAEDDGVEYLGGFAKVFMVGIHEEHHNFRDRQLCKRGFAIKQLYESNHAAFKREVNVLKRFSGDRSHPHVISLLATYEQFKKYHFIFYRAEGDLFKFWRQSEGPPDFTYRSVVWLARQCAGVADGLLKLHKHLTFVQRLDTEESLARKNSAGDKRVRVLDSPIQLERLNRRLSFIQRARPGSPTCVSGPKHSSDSGHVHRNREPIPVERYGRHGDINPGNILQYDDPRDDTGALRGTLKISDFGQAEFNSQYSRSRQRSVANTLTYRPPECDLQPRIIRQSYDIWCLGCVYLEFVTWMLGGNNLVQEFGEKRKARDIFHHPMVTDTFFRLVRNPEDNSTGVMIKPAVTNFIAELHRHPRCSDYFHELLDMIEHNMLIVESNQRKSCHEVWQALKKLEQKCVQNEPYAICGKPWSRHPWAGEPFREPVKLDIEEEAEQIIMDNLILLDVHPGQSDNAGLTSTKVRCPDSTTNSAAGE